MRRAKLARGRQLRLVHVHGDDRASAADPRALDRGEADAARSEDRDRRADLDGCGVQHRAETGRDAAADQGHAVNPDVRLDLHEGVLVDQHPLRVGREAGHLRHPGALPAQRRFVAGAAQRTLHAEERFAAEAAVAVPAEDREAGDHAVARREHRHVLTDRLDDSGALVAEHRRGDHRVEAVDEVQVGVADAARAGTDDDLAAARLVEVDLLDGECIVGGVEDCGSHRWLLAASRSAGGRRSGPPPAPQCGHAK